MANSTRQLSFHDNVPQWVRRVVRRERRILKLHNWRIRTQMDSQAEMAKMYGLARKSGVRVVAKMSGEGKLKHFWAVIVPDADYTSAVLHLADDIQCNQDGLDTIRHDLLHLPFFPLMDTVEKAQRAPKLTVRQARRFWEGEIENLIEHLVDVWDGLRPLRKRT